MASLSTAIWGVVWIEVLLNLVKLKLMQRAGILQTIIEVEIPRVGIAVNMG